MKKKRVCSIGGQAVLDGVMMRGKKAMATAVRSSDGSILIESERLVCSDGKKKIAKVPVLRGIVNFADSLFVGMRTTTRSTEVFGADEEEEPTKFEKWLAEKLHIDVMNVVTAVGVILGVLLSVGLFIVLPLLVAQGIFALAKLPVPSGKLLFFAGSDAPFSAGQIFGYNVLYNLILGVVRMSIFIGYIALISKMKDIRRLFMYHGAEHKTISCYENEEELTPKNAQRFSTQHDRCGTTFLFIVMAVSILFFTILPIDLIIPIENGVLQVVVRILLRIALVPIVAGVSYEFLKLFAKYDTKFSRAMKKPGLALQKLTTKEPADDMLEVAIAAFNEVLLLESDPTYPTKKFDLSVPAASVVKRLEKKLGDKTDAELIVMYVCGANTRTELYDGRKLDKGQTERAEKYADRRKTGAPLQYVIGSTCFMGMDFVCDARALIPRQDTEILAEQACRAAEKKDNPKVLDICTGSGVIAVTVKKTVSKAVVTASDISADALSLAKINAERLGADITFRTGSFFAPHKGEKFDIVTANPPYIPTGDIGGLDVSVKDYEPHLALDGGADGLDAYRDIASQIDEYLCEDGYLFLEAGFGQAEAIGAMFSQYEVSFVEDYNTPPVRRVVVCHKKPTEEKGTESDV